MLKLQTQGGLASRMRTVIPAKALAEIRGVPLVVNWSRHAHVLTEQGCQFKCGLGELWEGFDERNDHEKLPKTLDERMAINTCHPESFHPETLPPLGEVFNSLIPAPPLAQAIKDLPAVVEGSIGIHIRTEHPQPEATELKWYLELLSEIPKDAPIVLSCENSQVSYRIRQVRRDIIEQSKSYSYDRLGIIRAAADLYLLSQCCWIVGSARSSFSQLASWAQSDGPDPERWKDVKHDDWKTWIFGDRYLDDTMPDRKAHLLRDVRRTGGGKGVDSHRPKTERQASGAD